MGASPYLKSIRLERERVESFEQFPFSLPAIQNLDEVDLHPNVTFFVGENGSGKSTLLEAIAISLGFNPEGGSKNFNFVTRESHSKLHEFLTISKGISRPKDGFFLRAESFFNVATEIEKLDAESDGGAAISGAYGERPLHEQSHGESFLSLLNHRFRREGLYLLDEPEAALSPSRQLAVLSRMHQLVFERSQFVIATHSPILMAYPDAKIYSFGDKGIMPVKYSDTEHFRVTRDFLENTDQMLKILME